jgi:glyoxylase-like metal-dependent hydrolase (beta-lactamase superfamily II)
MRTTELSKDITQVTRMGMMNAYLVREDDGLTLVDTMAGGSAGGLLGAAERLGAPIRRARLGDVEVLIPARDARIVAGDRSLDPGEPEGKLKGSWPRKVATEPDRLLAAGDRVGSLEVVASPGHTPGHVAFLDSRDRALICGDAFHTLGGTTVAGQPNWRFPLVRMATWSPELALDSARELGALDPTALGPGHGRVLRDPQAEIDAAIERAGR